MVDHVKVYTVNGPAAGASSSLPDWLTRKRTAAKGSGKRAVREYYEGTIELLQDFEFPEASNKIRSTLDGSHLFATGTYKPQIRVWDLNQLSLKFERHTDAENVDFVLLSDDWTKSIHLQNDRSVELHTQGGFHYRTRIPRFGRSLAYHFPSCDAYITAAGPEVFRLNLEEGRFMTPLSLLPNSDDDDPDILGINVVDINPAHQLLAFGIDGHPSVQFWDPRSRSALGTVRLPILSSSTPESASAVTAIASRRDGLSYAIGSSSGHTFLYDIRSPKPLASKDQGYGLPIQSLSWIDPGQGDRMAAEGLVISADKKVIKIWDKSSPQTNFVSITPASDLNDIHHVPGSGLLMTANEGIQMSAYFVPQLGPAPKWASFLENITEEMEEQSTRSVYQDFKFIERKDLSSLGIDHLIGTPALKPYMHGYFVSLKLYETARLVANPFAYAEHRERLVKEKMEKMADNRIRATGNKQKTTVKVNKALADKILKQEHKKSKRQTTDDDNVPTTNLLNDPRFSHLFEDPEFAIDEQSHEYALLNPSSVHQHKANGKDESDLSSGEEIDDQDDSISSGSEEEEDDENDEGLLTTAFQRRPSSVQKTPRDYQHSNKQRHRKEGTSHLNLVPMSARSNSSGTPINRSSTTFGQQRRQRKNAPSSNTQLREQKRSHNQISSEISWTPSSGNNNAATSEGDSMTRRSGKRKSSGGGMFLEKGSEIRPDFSDDSSRRGREKRRQGVRSGSKAAFRRT